jgi:hypothetical protein
MATPVPDGHESTITAMSETGSAAGANANLRRQQDTWTIVGPLTTAFSPPQDCSRLKGVRYDTYLDLFWGGECSTRRATQTVWPGRAVITPATSCYPSGYTFEAAWFEFGIDLVSYYYATTFYSPGLTCPTGWSAIRVGTYGQRLNLDGALKSLLKPGETLVGCCPE